MQSLYRGRVATGQKKILKKGRGMSKRLIEDSDQAFEAWREAPKGSYVERAMADAIVADLFTAVLHALEAKKNTTGFDKDEN